MAKEMQQRAERRKEGRKTNGGFFDQDFWLEPMDFWRRSPRILSRMAGPFPRVDVSETDTDVVVRAEVPGIDPEDLDVEVRRNWMCLRGAIAQESASDERPYRYERAYGEFRREFTLPTEVDDEQVKASYKDGVLTVRVPKIQRSGKGKVPIERVD